MNRFSILAFLFSIVSCVKCYDTTTIEVHLQIQCQHLLFKEPDHETYAYEIDVMELDGPFSHDDLVSSTTGNARYGKLNLKLIGTQDDDEIFSDAYEIQLRVRHGCSDRSFLLDLRRTFNSKCPYNSKNCRYDLFLDLTGQYGKASIYTMAKIT